MAPASNRASAWTSPRPLAAPVTIITFPLSEKSERGDGAVTAAFSLFWVEVRKPAAGTAGWSVDDVLTRFEADFGERKLDGLSSLPNDLKQDICVVVVLVRWEECVSDVKVGGFLTPHFVGVKRRW